MLPRILNFVNSFMKIITYKLAQVLFFTRKYDIIMINGGIILGKTIGYGCVSTGTKSVKAEDKLTTEQLEWRKSTKVYEETKKLTNFFFPEEDVRIDVLCGSYRNRRYLKECLNTMGHGDTILIASMSALGRNTDEVLVNYRAIHDAEIGLLLPDYQQINGLSIFSTTDFTFTPILLGEEAKFEFEELCDKIRGAKISTFKGRKGLEITKEFKVIYWLYERYLIDPKTAASNKYFSMSKNTFRRCCETYESSVEYEQDLIQQDEMNKVCGIPKRFGAIKPQLETVINRIVFAQESLENACEENNLRILSKKQFDRIMMKYFLKKGGTLKVAFEMRDEELIASLQPDYK